MNLVDLPNQLRDLGASVRDWEQREYDACAEYCQIRMYGQHDPVVLTRSEFEQRERENWARHANRHVSRAGLLLSKAFNFGLFDDLVFFEVHCEWRRHCKLDQDSPSPSWWAAFFSAAVSAFHELQERKEIGGVSLSRPPWATKGPIQEPMLQSRSRELTQSWLVSTLEQLARLVEASITPDFLERQRSVPAYLIPTLDRLSRDLARHQQPLLESFTTHTTGEI